MPDARNLLGRSYQLQKKFTEALEAWREYLAKHPAHEAWSSVQQQIIDTEYLMGLEKRQAKQYDAGREAVDRVSGQISARRPQPGDPVSVRRDDFEQEKWDEAIAEWRRLVSKYPQHQRSLRRPSS